MNEPDASYAYLLEKNKQRTCQKDIAYCTWDEKGNPIPFCFEYPNDKKCQHNTQPPNILFMGCYDDPTCDGKPVGSPIIRRSTPPYAYTVDGQCRPSSELCYWLTDDIAIPTCAKDASVAKCRDVRDNYLIGCYTDETCGGMKQAQEQPIQTDFIVPDDNQTRKKQVNLLDDNDTVEIADGGGNFPVKSKTKNQSNMILIITFLNILFFLFASFMFYSYFRRKHSEHQSRQLYRKPKSLMQNRTM